MAGTKEIKSHIASVQETRKITNAMYLISSTKLRKARADLDHTRPYFRALKGEIKRIFRTADRIDSHYFFVDDDHDHLEGPCACLVITADKGLAGAYNQNAIREALRLREEFPEVQFFVVGEYGRHFFAQHQIPIEQSFLYTAQNPSMQRAREISALLLNGFDTGKFNQIFVVYTDMENAMSFRAQFTRLLPFHRKFFADTPDAPVESPFEFVPDVRAVLDNMVQSYVSGFIYSALIDSFCCEQNARMTAMDSANQNAEKLLGELSLQYNRVRQAAITQEITEISAGAKAQRQQRKER